MDLKNSKKHFWAENKELRIPKQQLKFPYWNIFCNKNASMQIIRPYQQQHQKCSFLWLCPLFPSPTRRHPHASSGPFSSKEKKNIIKIDWRKLNVYFFFPQFPVGFIAWSSFTECQIFWNYEKYIGKNAI